MIDYILSFPDEATAIAALPDWRKNGQWRGKRKSGIFPISIILQRGVWDNSDPENPIQISPEILSPGYWMAIARPDPDPALWAMPYVMSEHDREAAIAGQSHILQTRLTVEQIAGVIDVRPIFAGSNYPFDGGRAT